MIASALGALYAGGDLFVLFWLSAGVAVNWEWQRLIGGEVGKSVRGGSPLSLSLSQIVEDPFEVVDQPIANRSQQVAQLRLALRINRH